MSAKYPHLSEIIREMARDNYGTLYADRVRPEGEWVWPVNAEALERTAAAMTRDERLTLAGGEYSDQARIVTKYRCRKLNQFINDVFDGDLSANFFKW